MFWTSKKQGIQDGGRQIKEIIYTKDQILFKKIL